MSQETMLKLGKKIKRLREKQKLTQQKLADVSGFNIKHLQKIEGKTPINITLKTLINLAKALKTTPSKLLS
jgi:transcriptional regulator with XRE-family HTH domain